MKSLFENKTAVEIDNRIDKLTPQSQREWGKMDVSQMMAHCSAALEVASGKVNLSRMLIGRIVGTLFKSKFYDEKPFDKNTPTAKSFMMTDKKDFETEKENLKKFMNIFSSGGREQCTKHPHAFFGKLTAEQWGVGMYKHMDHHLRQFGV